MTPKHLPPSRRRFELSHPTVTTRISRELHLALMDLAEADAKTLAEIVRNALASYVEPDVVEDDGDELEPRGPESHPEYVELTAKVERLRTEPAATHPPDGDPYLAGLP